MVSLKFKCISKGDIQKQRGWIARFLGKMDLVAGALFLCFIFFPQRDAYGMGVPKKMKTILRTSKSRLNYSLQGWHYPKYLKNIVQFTKIKRFNLSSI